MKYRIRQDGSLKSQGAIRQLHSNKSLPRTWTESVCDALGIDPVLAAPKPQPSTNLKTVVKDGVVQDVKGNWVEAYTERDMFSDYTDENEILVTKAEQEAEYLTNLAATAKADAIATAERLVKQHVQDGVDTFNTTYGVNFESVYNMPVYASDTNYPLHTQCTALMAWNNSVWLTARQLQIDIDSGTKEQPETEELFLAELPVYVV